MRKEHTVKFWKSLTRRAVPLLLAAALLVGYLPAARAAGRFTVLVVGRASWE